MNAELIEKLTAIREDLVAFQAQAKLGDLKKLADLVEEKFPMLERNYGDLYPYMTMAQVNGARTIGLVALKTCAQLYPERGHEREFTDLFTKVATTEVRRMSDDLEAFEPFLRWLCAIADHMGCPLSELLRFQPDGFSGWPRETKTAE